MPAHSLRIELFLGVDTVYVYVLGRVTAPAQAASQFTPGEAWDFLGAVDQWCQAVRIVEDDEGDLHETPMTIENEVTDSELKWKLNNASLVVDFKYDRVTRMITAQSRPTFDISWPSFKHYLGRYKGWLELIKLEAGRS